MVASAADDGVVPTIAEASAKLLASPEVDELEADYAKSGYLLAARLLGEDEGKIHRVDPKFGPTCELWATPVNFRWRDSTNSTKHMSATDRARPGG